MSKNNDNKSMVFFFDWLDLFEELDDAEIGQIVKAIAVYAQTGEEPEFADRSIRIVFKSMKNSIDLCNERKESVANARREAANKRWNNVEAEAVAEEDDAKNANAQFAQNKNANDAYNTIHNNTINNNTIPNNTEQKKKKQSSEKVTATAVIEDKCFPADVENAVKDWVKYKQERRQAYKETGLKNLLSEVQNKIQDVGIEQVVYAIRHSISSNWQGIAWDTGSKSKSSSWDAVVNRVNIVDTFGTDREKVTPW